MLFTEEYIVFNKSKIYYYKFGKGKKALLAFHGFGQFGRDFSVFEGVERRVNSTRDEIFFEDAKRQVAS